MAPPSPTGVAYRGVIVVPIVIRKDGSVKVDRKGIFPPRQSFMDISETVINKWRYKPYLVDGQPVEVAISVHYVMDGKPFVPSYDCPKVKPVATAPEDFSSAYDPTRDPAKDLLMAEKQAKQANKRILVEVGGNWCGWCKLLDKFYVDHADLLKLRGSNYVLMKVNMSGLNENYPFLSQYPKISGYPWLFVLDADGKLLVSKNTNDLENHLSGYDDRAIRDFLLAWKP
jgi:thiol-disulfide isomerase/thioredoxin